MAISDKLVYTSNAAKAVLLFSNRNRIPFIGLTSAWVKAGAVNALHQIYLNLGKRNARIALKIPVGTKPEII